MTVVRPFVVSLLLVVLAGLSVVAPDGRADDDADAAPDDPPVRDEADWAFTRPQLQVGTRLDVTLPSMTDGEPVSLRRFRGRKLLLHVFASW